MRLRPFGIKTIMTSIDALSRSSPGTFFSPPLQTRKMSLFEGNKRTGFGLWKVNRGLDSASALIALADRVDLQVPNDSAADTVYNALKAGYRLLDGAADYGNEKECGQGLRRAIEDGIVKREEVFIVSKLWNTNHAREHVVPACKKGLELWGIDYFDLFLVHFPVSLKYVDPAERCKFRCAVRLPTSRDVDQSFSDQTHLCGGAHRTRPTSSPRTSTWLRSE